MLTPTLFDVATIIGLRPTDETYDPSIVSEENSFDVPTKKATYSNYLSDHYKTDTNEVSDQEHIAFLTCWISHYVFCISSLQVAKKFVGMVIQLHEGNNFCLGGIIL